MVSKTSTTVSAGMEVRQKLDTSQVQEFSEKLSIKSLAAFKIHDPRNSV